MCGKYTESSIKINVYISPCSLVRHCVHENVYVYVDKLTIVKVPIQNNNTIVVYQNYSVWRYVCLLILQHRTKIMSVSKPDYATLICLLSYTTLVLVLSSCLSGCIRACAWKLQLACASYYRPSIGQYRSRLGMKITTACANFPDGQATETEKVSIAVCVVTVVSGYEFTDFASSIQLHY